MNPVDEKIDDLPEKEVEVQLETQETALKTPLFSDLSFSAIVVVVLYVLSLSVLLSFFYKAGKYLEYALPFYLLEINLVNLIIIISTLGVAILSAVAIVKLNSPNNKFSPQNRTQKITDFFAAIATLSIAFYFITIVSLLIKNNYFPLEALYLFMLYGLIVFFYFMQKKTHLAYNLVSSGFVIILLITAFYLGINLARVEDKLIVTIDDEAFSLVTSYNDNIILAGYSRASKRFNGKIKIVNNNTYQDLIFISNKN